MKQFFHGKIENWSDWGCVFQSIPAFDGLIREIFRREALPCSGISNLTPGTNAVFRVGDYVIKIFFPMESGLDPLPDFQNEAAVCGVWQTWTFPCPDSLLKEKFRIAIISTISFLNIFGDRKQEIFCPLLP